jgi:predicted O-methyltransferase YrrM
MILDAAFPPLVQQAMARATEKGFARSCVPEVGRLLRVLASQVQHGVIGEIGSGSGVGTAWLASGLGPDVTLITVEHDVTLAATVQTLVAAMPNVRAHCGDWRELLADGPFTLLFVDTADAKRRDAETTVQALAPGGTAILDDLTPMEHWPPEWHGKPDPVRDFWLHHPALTAVEVRVTATHAVILAVRTARYL